MTISGRVPSSGSLFVRVHIDYQIDGSLTEEEVASFSDPSEPFTYLFKVEVIGNIFGVH